MHGTVAGPSVGGVHHVDKLMPYQVVAFSPDFIKQRPRYGLDAAPGHFFISYAHSPESRQNGRSPSACLAASCSEKPFPDLRSQRNDGRRVGLAGGVTPFAGLEVDFFPPGLLQLAGVHERIRRNLNAQDTMKLPWQASMVRSGNPTCSGSIMAA